MSLDEAVRADKNVPARTKLVAVATKNPFRADAGRRAIGRKTILNLYSFTR
jgi:hypothetical protein